VAPAARSSFHRARIAAISSKSGCSIFVLVIPGLLWATPKNSLQIFANFKRQAVGNRFVVIRYPNEAVQMKAQTDGPKARIEKNAQTSHLRRRSSKFRANQRDEWSPVKEVFNDSGWKLPYFKRSKG
jgi:hypothetical protein